MNPVPRKIQEEDQKLIDEYLKNGGKVSIQKPYAQSEDLKFNYGFYGKKKPQDKTEE